ncbi:MAG: biotin/lipoyl-containing protein [Novosphingobium sp.]
MSKPGNLGDIEQLIAEFKQSGLRELQARCGDFEIYLSLDRDAPGFDGLKSSTVATATIAAPAPAQPAAGKVAEPASAAAEIDVPDGAVVIRAPYLGTFYRSPKPGAPAYVEIGGKVSPESELCLVEVMKLFTAVRAGVAGEVTQVLASDGELVAADQPLFVVIPD